jgi:predicted metalloprotease with PDZ domain
VPNSLSLEGDYDWFFEGFTLYQALLTDVRLGLISFDDYLETIGRVYSSYLASSGGDSLSLIEASERRWTTSPSLVYDKGMLVAFIYDLMIRSRTNCKASLSDVYGELFRAHSTGQGNANETIIRLLGERAGLEAFVKDYVEGRGKLDFHSQFTRHGLQIQTNDARPRLRVGAGLDRTQRALLVCLGYKS